MRNKITTAFLAIALMAATMSYGTPEQDRLWATRVTCELQTAGAQSLPALTFSQGSTPLISLDQFRAGKSVNADSNIVARLVFGPTQTNQYYVAVTNYAVSGNGYLIQCPSVGTNTTASGAWWYTAYFESDTGKRYWTGNGRLNIVSTTSTADGLTWQEFVSGDSISPDELAAALLGYEPLLPSTPTNPASKYLNGNREWSSISLGHPQLSDFNGDVNYQHITTGQVAKLDYISDSGVLRVHDTAQPSRYFMEVVNSTGTVFEVTGPFTNLMVTLTEDFVETVNDTRPLWAPIVFPFLQGPWSGYFENGAYQIVNGLVNASWISDEIVGSSNFPIELAPYANANGTATVSIASIYYTTNAFAHFTTESELEAAKAACGVVLTNTVNAATNALMPYARTLYGDLATTNEAGYAAFNTTNAAAASYSAIAPTSFIGSNTNTFRYRFNSLRKFGAVTNTAWFVKSGFGAGVKSVSTLVSVKDASGNVLSQSSSQPVYLSDSSSPSSVTNIFTMPDNVYSGTLDVACIAVSTNASFSVRLYSGAQYTNMLTFSEAPTPYATYAELSSLREEIPAIVDGIARSIRTSETNIVVSSTNSVYYVALTNAANVGFDFSALSLGGTKRADITAVIDCLNTQALYSAINTNAVAMDCPWEPTVTGRYELAVSSDGVRTAARQVWPQVAVWRTLKYTYAPGGGWIDSLQRFNVDNSNTNSLIVDCGIVSPLIFVRFNAFLNINKPISFEYGYASVIGPLTDKPSVVYGPFGGPEGGVFMDVARPVEFGAEISSGRLLQVWIGNQSPESIATVMFYPSRSRARAANALERSAYNAGAYPAAFRLDY